MLKSLWGGRGQSFGEVKSLLLIFLLYSGKLNLVTLWNLHSHQQQEQPHSGPVILLTAPDTRRIMRNSKWYSCSSTSVRRQAGSWAVSICFWSGELMKELTLSSPVPFHDWFLCRPLEGCSPLSDSDAAFWSSFCHNCSKRWWYRHEEKWKAFDAKESNSSFSLQSGEKYAIVWFNESCKTEGK